MSVNLIIQSESSYGFLNQLWDIATFEGKQVVVFTTERICELYPHYFQCSHKNRLIHILPDGEGVKSFFHYQSVIDFLVSLPLHRDGVLVAVGGGSLLDFIGFVAATYLRGVAFYSLPTTLLAMVDAAIGGKVGINTVGGKNLVGTFYEPKSICIDEVFLKTLPKNEFACGMIEIIKMALLSGGDLYDSLHQYMFTPHVEGNILKLIQKSIEYKQKIVNLDFYEVIDTQGMRKILNFGHTLGHALEQVTQFNHYKHGEAVGIGILFALFLSEKLCGLPMNIRLMVEEWLDFYKFQKKYLSSITYSALYQAFDRDKKFYNGQLLWILLKNIGEPCVETVPPVILEETLHEFQIR